MKRSFFILFFYFLLLSGNCYCQSFFENLIFNRDLLIDNDHIIDFPRAANVRNYFIENNIKKITTICTNEKKDKSGSCIIDTAYINNLIFIKNENIIIDSTILVDEEYKGIIVTDQYLFKDNELIAQRSISNAYNNDDSIICEKFYYYNKNLSISMIIDITSNDTTKIEKYFYNDKEWIEKYSKTIIKYDDNGRRTSKDSLIFDVKYSDKKITILINDKLNKIYQLNNFGKLEELSILFNEDNIRESVVDSTIVKYSYADDLVFIQGRKSVRCWKVIYILKEDALVSRNIYQFNDCGVERYVNNTIGYYYNENKLLKSSIHLLVEDSEDLNISEEKYLYEFY